MRRKGRGGGRRRGDQSRQVGRKGRGRRHDPRCCHSVSGARHRPVRARYSGQLHNLSCRGRDETVIVFDPSQPGWLLRLHRPVSHVRYGPLRQQQFVHQTWVHLLQPGSVQVEGPLCGQLQHRPLVVTGSGSETEEEMIRDRNSGSESETDEEMTKDPNSGSGSETDEETIRDRNTGSGSETDEEMNKDPKSGSGSETEEEMIRDPNSGSGSETDEEMTMAKTAEVKVRLMKRRPKTQIKEVEARLMERG